MCSLIFAVNQGKLKYGRINNQAYDLSMKNGNLNLYAVFEIFMADDESRPNFQAFQYRLSIECYRS